MIRFVTKPRDCAHHLLTHKSAEKSRMKESPSEGGQLNQAGTREKRGGMWPHLWPQNPRPRRRGGRLSKCIDKTSPSHRRDGGQGDNLYIQNSPRTPRLTMKATFTRETVRLTPHQTARRPLKLLSHSHTSRGELHLKEVSVELCEDLCLPWPHQNQILNSEVVFAGVPDFGLQSHDHVLL